LKALVTGGGGFIGRHVVDQLLQRGDTVTVFARGAYPEIEARGARLIQGDLQSAGDVSAACTGQDAVFHVAAKAGVWGSFNSYYGPNVTGTRNVIEGCRRQDVSRLVFTSSPSVVFDNRHHRGADESLPYPERFENPYSETKAMAERMVLEADSQTLRTVALRPHLVFGPGDPHLLPRIIAKARANRLVQVGGGETRVDLTFVEDAARAHLLAEDALQRGASGRAYFISQDAPVSLWGWIRELLDALGVAGPRRSVSAAAARRAGAVLETLHRLLRLPGEPHLTRFVASQLALDHYYDISRAKRDLDYTPQHSMTDALERTLPDLKARCV
jgi:nucleoside-diphosphate-sugar epimerase